jgi:Xaa-Pro aminopeptidase
LNNNQLQLGSGFVVHEEEVVLPEGDKLQIKTNRYFPQEPGIYTSGTQKYAVNLKYSESDFKLIKFPETVKVAKNNWQQYIFTSRYGYEIWKLVLILVLLLFIWEMFLVKKREKR